MTQEIGPLQVDANIECVVIPDSVKEICENAFANLEQLQRVVFLEDSRLSSFKSCCFKNSGITDISAPASLRRVEVGAFLGCANLRHVTFSEGLETIGELAFARTAVESVRLPSTLRYILNSFDDCVTVRDVFLPAGHMEVCYDAVQRRYTGTLFVPADVKNIQYSPAYAYFGL